MRLSTKIFLAIWLITLVPAIVLTRYIYQDIQPTETGFIVNFSVASIIGLCFWGVSAVFFMICYLRFIRVQKMSRALFFSILPLSLFYGLSIYLVAGINTLPSTTSSSVKIALKIDTTNPYNAVLWASLLTLIYIILMFIVLAHICRPVQKIEKITKRLGDGRITEDKLHIGKSEQFKNIEDSLERINYNYKENENLVRQTNLEAQKFVPRQFLKFLGKSSISELELGNQVQKKATTLFCDIVSATAIGTTLSLEENFKFINSYLNVVSPLIRKYDGFVDKYMGDGLLAVFPRPERALDCAHAIIRTIEIKNKSNKHLPKVDARISINTGEIIFGIVGEEERKSPTIISDVVNLASKMEDVNKFLGTKLLFSKSTLNELPTKYEFSYRYVGSLNVDNQASISLFESLETYSRDKKNKLVHLKNKFENGVRSYNEENYSHAKMYFEEVLKYVSDDKPSYVYFNKSKDKLDV